MDKAIRHRSFKNLALLLFVGVLMLLGLAAANPATGSGPIARAGASASGSARLACAVYDDEIGEYGAWVFRLRDKPRSCTEYKGNRPCHCTESYLLRIHWRHWGKAQALGAGTWRYCGMGACIKRKARLRASRLRNRCGVPAYTKLRMHLSGFRFAGKHYPQSWERFRLPACETVFDET